MQESQICATTPSTSSPKVNLPGPSLESWVSAFEVWNIRLWMHHLVILAKMGCGKIRRGERAQLPSLYFITALRPGDWLHSPGSWSYTQKASDGSSQRFGNMNLKACPLWGQFSLWTSKFVDLGILWSEHRVPISGKTHAYESEL